MANRNYWAVGATFGGTDDVSDEFKENNEWFDGYADDGDDRHKGWLEKMQIGDVLVMKSSATKGPGHSTSFTKVKGVGVLLSKHDYYHFQMKWLDIPGLPMDFDDISYRKTIEPLRNDDLSEFIKPYVKKFEMTNILSLLQYKKQVILQGPPGTGKTKLAKEIALALTRPKTITADDIKRLLKVGQTVKSKSDGIPYKVVTINDKGISLQLENGSIQTRNYHHIKQAYSNLLENKSSIGGDAYQAAIAKYAMENWEDERISKIIQFHPSYSYEDFVRGIVAEAKGDNIEYKNVNKILGKFADSAKKSWDDNKKDINHISKENRAREYFEQFVDDLSERITGGELVELTPSVSLIDVEEDAFRYKGNAGWSTLGNRMLFKDIIQAFLDGNKVRQDIKKNKNLSGLAIQHASYFVRVLNMFQEYLASNNLKFDRLSTDKVELKNYVLIIDEINRANLSSVLGELIYALEYRGENVESTYEVDGSNALVLPDNLYIIGTMNTADRSVGHIDYAIRRRFAFVDVPPKDLTTELGDKFHKKLFDAVTTLFDNNLSAEFEKKDVQLGHSYFIDKSDEGGSMDVRLQYEIKPILMEYVKDGILIGDKIKQTIEELKA